MFFILYVFLCKAVNRVGKSILKNIIGVHYA